MCTLYSLRVKRWEIADYYNRGDDFRRDIEREEMEKDYVSPKREGWIVHQLDGQRELAMMNWGFPHWKPGEKDVVNVRNYRSNFWRTALTNPERRCLVPFDRFQEWSVEPDPTTGKKTKHWFSIPSRPIGTFAGIWRSTETGPRFAFLTTGYCDDPDDKDADFAAAMEHVVGRIHPKAIPVILHDEHFDQWLNAPIDEALKLATAFPSQLIAVE